MINVVDARLVTIHGGPSPLVAVGCPAVVQANTQAAGHAQLSARITCKLPLQLTITLIRSVKHRDLSKRPQYLKKKFYKISRQIGAKILSDKMLF